MLRRIALVLAVAATVVPVSASARSDAHQSLRYPQIVRFGHQLVGEVSEARVTIHNTGHVSILLGPAGIVAHSGDPSFGMTDPAERACFGAGEVAELPAGASCSILVNFTPLAPGEYRALLSISVQDDEDVSVKLIGSGALS